MHTHAGFHHLTKLECKRDTRDIDKRSALMNMNETDSDDEIEQAVPVTLHPPCSSEGTAYKKLSRLTGWTKDSGIKYRDLQQAHSAVRTLRRELGRVQSEENKWLNCFEMGRSQLSASLTRNREFNARLSREMKHLYALALAECGPSTRKRRNLCMRDCLEELHERQVVLNLRIAEYDRLANDALTAVAEKEGKTVDAAYALAKSIPMTRMTLTEDRLLDYPYDAEMFAKQLYTSQSSKGGDAAARNAAVVAAAAADAAKAFRESVEEQKSEESLAQQQQSAEQRDLVASVEIQRGATLPAVEGAAGAANAAGRAAAAAAAAEEEEKDKSARISRSKVEASKAKEVPVVPEREEEAGAATQSHPGRELISLFNSVEEAITFGRANLGDVDVFFGDDFSNADEKIRNTAARAGFAGLSSPKSPRSGSIVDDTIRDLGSGDASAAMITAICEVSGTLVPDADKAAVLVAPLNALQTEADWTKHLDTLVNTVDGRGDNTRRKRRVQTTVHLQTFSYPRTPRGVPLLVSPLSQFEDRFLGAVYGGPTGTSSFTGNIRAKDNAKLPYANSLLPVELEREENRVILHCSLQSAAASYETKIRRLRNSLQEAKKQIETSEMSSMRAEQVYVHTLLEDTIECKRIRRELQAFGIGSHPAHSRDAVTPMSPLAETSGWNSQSNNGRIGNGVVGPVGGRGLPWGRHKKKQTSQGDKLAEALRLQASQEQAVREAALYRHEMEKGLEAASGGGAGTKRDREEDDNVSHVSDAEGDANGNGSVNGDATEESEAAVDKPPAKKKGRPLMDRTFKVKKGAAAVGGP